MTGVCHDPRPNPSMRTPYLTLCLLLALGQVTLAEIVVGGREYSRAVGEAGKKGEWVLYPKGAPQEAGYRRWLTKRVLVDAAAGVPLANAQAIRSKATTWPLTLTYTEFPGAHEIRPAELQAAMAWLGELAG